MYYIMYIATWSVLVSCLWCLGTTKKTFCAVMGDTAIDAPAFYQSVSTIIGCGLKCNADTRCLSFTICDENDKNVCRLFDKDYWEKAEVKCSRSCKYYEEAHYCDRNLKNKLVNFMAPLGILLPNHLLQDQKKFSCSHLKETKPQRNHLVETIPKLSKSWFVSFDVNPIEMNSLIFTSIIHFTKGGNNGNHGDRTPAVWLLRNTFDLVISSDVNGNYDYRHSPTFHLHPESFSNIMIIQHQNDAGKYIYQIFINANEVFQIENNEPREFENVQVYLGNPWHTAANAVVRNLVYSNLE